MTERRDLILRLAMARYPYQNVQGLDRYGWLVDATADADALLAAIDALEKDVAPNPPAQPERVCVWKADEIGGCRYFRSQCGHLLRRDAYNPAFSAVCLCGGRIDVKP